MDDDDWGDQLGGMTLSLRYNNGDITFQLTGSVNWTPEACSDYFGRMVHQVRELNAGIAIDSMADE